MMKTKENVLIYFECISGVIFSKIGVNKLPLTNKLKHITNNVIDNLSYEQLNQYIHSNNIDIIFYITNNFDNIKKIKSNKSIRIIPIDLNDFIKNPYNY